MNLRPPDIASRFIPHCTPVSPATCNACASLFFHRQRGLHDAATARFDGVVDKLHRIERGEQLYAGHDALRLVYAVCFGQFKTMPYNLQGHEQITDFHMSGDLMGLDAIEAVCPTLEVSRLGATLAGQSVQNIADCAVRSWFCI